ncbi:MAG: hypothetical protein ACI9H6_000273 [Patiriisocius sp.]|jgi:hypothetical protein
MIKQYLQHKGALLILVLVFASIFFMMITSFMGFAVSQSQVQKVKYQQEQAREIAEAGLNYYKWYLAHNPDDVTNGTGVAGPYIGVYNDPELGAIGEYSLEIASSTFCGEVSSIDINATGYTYEAPTQKREIYGKYARPTVAEFAYIINSNVWAGSDRTIIGPYHSNGIIRMDGTNNSTVTSGQENWVCDGSLSCAPDPNGATLDGVYGDGPNDSLWTFPSTPINFTGLTVDLSVMRDRAENGGGIYLGPSGDEGYNITFNSDDTITVEVVDRVRSYSAYNSTDGWHTERNIIRTLDPPATYNIGANCPLIFAEDKVWLQGEISTKVTLAAADTDSPGVDPSMVLNGNITYTSTSSGLLAVAENNVLVGYDVPNDMVLNGIFVAQEGRFGRNYYNASSYGGDRYRNSLTMNGTIVSNGRVGTKWSCSGVYCSGFETRYNAYDRDLVDNPPPLAPKTSDDYKFIQWREVN